MRCPHLYISRQTNFVCLRSPSPTLIFLLLLPNPSQIVQEGEMMLRSASTPSLGSPVPSFTADSPRKISCNTTTTSFHSTVAKSIVSSPDSAENIDLRRAQSAGNLEECFNVNGEDFMTLSRQSSRRLSRKPTLEAIHSFYPSDGDEEEEEEEEGDEAVVVERGFNPLNFSSELRGVCDMGMGFPGEGKMYLAAGIGVNALGFLEEYCGYGGNGGWGGGGGNRPGDDFNRDGGDNRGIGMEDHYKKMLLQSPGNPLILRNYAHFLYQTKGDLAGAEVYYSRAILADPEDGDILCQYARVIWELHHDQERARSYFQRAMQASSQDSNINASYASFLWDIEGDEDEDEDVVTENLPIGAAPFFHQGIMASATA